MWPTKPCQVNNWVPQHEKPQAFSFLLHGSFPRFRNDDVRNPIFIPCAEHQSANLMKSGCIRPKYLGNPKRRMQVLSMKANSASAVSSLMWTSIPYLVNSSMHGQHCSLFPSCGPTVGRSIDGQCKVTVRRFPQRYNL